MIHNHIVTFSIHIKIIVYFSMIMPSTCNSYINFIYEYNKYIMTATYVKQSIIINHIGLCLLHAALI